MIRGFCGYMYVSLVSFASDKNTITVILGCRTKWKGHQWMKIKYDERNMHTNSYHDQVPVRDICYIAQGTVSCCIVHSVWIQVNGVKALGPREKDHFKIWKMKEHQQLLIFSKNKIMLLGFKQ